MNVPVPLDGLRNSYEHQFRIQFYRAAYRRDSRSNSDAGAGKGEINVSLLERHGMEEQIANYLAMFVLSCDSVHVDRTARTMLRAYCISLLIPRKRKR